MSFNLQSLLHSQEVVLAQAEQYKIHIDFKTRLILLSETKKLLAVYFKESIALSNILLEQRNSTLGMESTVSRYVHETHGESRKIIALFQKYNANSSERERFKFQMDIAQALSLLEHHIGIEKKYFIPEYKSNIARN